MSHNNEKCNWLINGKQKCVGKHGFITCANCKIIFFITMNTIRSKNIK